MEWRLGMRPWRKIIDSHPLSSQGFPVCDTTCTQIVSIVLILVFLFDMLILSDLECFEVPPWNAWKYNNTLNVTLIINDNKHDFKDWSVTNIIHTCYYSFWHENWHKKIRMLMVTLRILNVNIIWTEIWYLDLVLVFLILLNYFLNYLRWWTPYN